MAQGGAFRLIVVKAGAEGREEAASRLAQALHIKAEIARKVLEGAPVVLIPDLDKAEVRALSPVLQEISRLGVEFRITARETGDLPVVQWLTRPNFVETSPGGPHAVAFQWNGSAFVCPSCGETFLFQRLGKLPLGKSSAEATTVRSAASSAALRAVQAKTPAAATPKPAAAQPAAAPPPQPPMPKPEPSPEPVPQDVQPVPDGAGAVLDLEAELGGLEPAGASAAETAGGDVGDLLEGLEPAGAPAAPSASEPAGLDLGGVDLDLGGDLQVEGLLPMDGADAAAPGGEAAPAAEAPAVEEAPPGEGYNVFVSQVKDKSKRIELAKIVAEVRKMNIKEAVELTNRTMFMAAKNVPKEVADKLVAQFKKMQVSARVTKATG
jgi:ribosomal protein L7/L12